MLIWGIIWGALLGLMWPGEGYWLLGGLLGLAAGYSLNRSVRKTIREQLAVERAAWQQAVTEPSAPSHDLRSAQASTPAAAAVQGAAAMSSGVAAAQAGPVVRSDNLPALAAEMTAAATRAAQRPAAASATMTPQGLPISQRPARAAPDTTPLEHDSFFGDDALQVAATASQPAATPSRPAPQSPRAVDIAAPKPATPPADPVAQAFAAVRNWFMGGNTIVRVGLVILFIGLSFLARYAVQMGLLPVELRLAAIGAVGIALLGVGFRQRVARPGFGLVMQGAGVAVLYLTVFAAFRLYGLLPQMVAFALMALVCALSCALALLQNARGLAFAAFAGGFATPLLLSDGRGSPVALFSYYALLDLAILFIAWRRSWRELNLLGFLVTFGTATAWGWMRYTPERYASAQGFLLLFMAIFVAASVLYARNTPTRLGNAVDSTLVFGTPLVGFGLQYGLSQHLWNGPAFAALGFGAAYLLLATVLARQALKNYRLLIECFVALGVGFATLAVPLALDMRWTSAVWALEGAAALWVGARQARWMPRAFGLLLQALAGLNYWASWQPPVSTLALLHPGFVGALVLALPALASAWWLRKPLAHSGTVWAQTYGEMERSLSTPLFLYGFAWVCMAWAQEIWRVVPAAVAGAPAQPVWAEPTAALLMALAVLVSALVSLLLSLRTQWAVASWPARLGLPVLGVALLLWAQDGNLLSAPALILWALLLALHGACLYLSERKALPQQGQSNGGWSRWLAWQHPGTVWLKLALLGRLLWQLIERAELGGTAWAQVTWLMAGVVVLAALTLWAGRAHHGDARRQLGWPLSAHGEGYYWVAALPVVALVVLGGLMLTLTSSGRTAPLPYIPLLNPTDLAVALAFGAVLMWRQMMVTADPLPPGAAGLAQRGFWMAVGGAALVALSTVWLRVAHHFFGVPWDAGALFGSFVVQTGYSILWTLLALVLMVAAQRRASRGVWLAGAALLGLVVVKLVLIDLSNRGGGERIIAFIGVGLLMLVVGYFAPLPPRMATAQNEETAA